MLELVVARGEAALCWRLLTAIERGDRDAFGEWNARFLASRESAELRAETVQTGGALFKLARDLDLPCLHAPPARDAFQPLTLPAAYALAAHGFGIGPAAALTAYLWSWLENQVMAAMKTVPLGQVAGQRLLRDLGARISAVVAIAQAVSDDEVTSFAPGLALASSRHETQYTRLFRS